MRDPLLLLATCALTLTPTTLNAEQYLCVAEKASGFHFNKSSGEWDHAEFSTDQKYVISTGSEDIPFIVRMLGSSSSSLPYAVCKDGFNDYGVLRCDAALFAGSLMYTRGHGRFTTSYLGAYHAVGLGDITDESADTPNIQIGKCTPF